MFTSPKNFPAQQPSSPSKGGPVFKIILIGDAGVGKSSILHYFLNEKFAEEYNVTIGMEFGSKDLVLRNGTPATLQIWDSAGQEYFRSVVRSFYRNTAAVVVVYDICRKDTLDAASVWLDEAKSNQDKDNTIYVLVGNQNDRENERQVSLDMGQKFAKEKDFNFFLETSARSGANIEKIFVDIAETLYVLSKRPIKSMEVRDAKSSFILGSSPPSGSKREPQKKSGCC